MDTFKNYDNLLSSLSASTDKTTKERALATLKNKNDEMLKTIGEAKTFISGRSLLSKIGEPIAEKLKTAGFDALQRGQQAFRNSVNQKISSTGAEGEGGGEDIEMQEINPEGEGATTVGDIPEGAGGGEDVSNLGGSSSAMTAEDASKFTTGSADALEGGAEETAEIATGEAVSGVFDAIPGLDVIGVIGGAILAGIAGHRAHLQEKIIANSRAPQSLNVSSQIGIGGG